MKATGIVRRIDDLGRVVIPKEIRRTLNIKDNDPMEIYIEKDGCVIFKKYNSDLERDLRGLVDRLELEYLMQNEEAKEVSRLILKAADVYHAIKNKE